MTKYTRNLILIVASVVILTLVTLAGLFYCGAFGNHFVLTKTSFKHLPHWQNDNHIQALQTFQNSCSAILKMNPNLQFSSISQAGKVSDWQAICRAAQQLTNPDRVTAQQFFETWFAPYRSSNNYNTQGLFTGYYLPLIHGSLTPDAHYTVPIYAYPDDLVTVNLDLFHQSDTGKTIKGQLKNHTLLPYPDRQAINHGAIKEHAKVLAWSDSVTDVFFAQIQGSVVLELPDHQRIVLGHAGSNGRPYTAIGKILIAKKALAKNQVSMQTIRTWLMQHPDQIDAVLNSNASYTFFKILVTKDPLGSEQVPLTAERSLAVDQHYIPLGVPLWLDTRIGQDPTTKPIPFQQLMIAQDTGGAIKGIVRGDIYWGEGERAAAIAGKLQSKGRYWVLLPSHSKG